MAHVAFPFVRGSMGIASEMFGAETSEGKAGFGVIWRPRSGSLLALPRLLAVAVYVRKVRLLRG